ncbi:MAG: DUF4136 domain-containing protein [Verrucomicrobiia bacterium]
MRLTQQFVFFLALLPGTFWFAGCQGYQAEVGLTRDPQAEFAKYGSFSLSSPPLGAVASTEIETVLRETLREELLARGLREVAPDRADLLVTRHFSSKSAKAASHYSGGAYGVSSASLWPYGYGRGRAAMVGAPRVYTEMESLQKGSLMVAFEDRRLQKPVFVAVAKDVIGTDKGSAMRVRAAIQEMVRGLPER